MDNVIEKISKELRDDLENYELSLKSSLHSKVKLINLVVSYSIKHKGKRFRPLLCMLCSRLNNKTPNESTYSVLPLLKPALLFDISEEIFF